nr:MAG TPA: hypothetical protein [Microviridae sp.]
MPSSIFVIVFVLRFLNVYVLNSNTMRLYQIQKSQRFTAPAAVTVPGFTLSEIIAQFYAEGVVPDFIPADLGEDLVDETDAEGRWLVDPAGDIRTDRFDKLENDLMAGLDAVVDPAPASNPTPASDPAPTLDSVPASEAPPASEE